MYPSMFYIFDIFEPIPYFVIHPGASNNILSRYLPSGPPDMDSTEGMMIHRAVEEIMFLTSRTMNDQDMTQVSQMLRNDINLY